jgi:hypothetical protein
MNNTGTINFLFSQNTGYTFYNMGFACLSSAANVSPPNAVYSSPPQVGLPTNEQIHIGGLPCYGQYGFITRAATGAEFSGAVWVNYTLSQGAVSSANPDYYTKVGAIQVYVVNSTAGSATTSTITTSTTIASTSTVAFMATSTLTTVPPTSIPQNSPEWTSSIPPSNSTIASTTASTSYSTTIAFHATATNTPSVGIIASIIAFFRHLFGLA